MFNLVYRQLIHESFRTLLTTFAIAGALAVILLLEGFLSGLYSQLKNVSLNRGADLIVAQSGIYEKKGYRKNPIFFIIYDTAGGASRFIENQKCSALSC